MGFGASGGGGTSTPSVRTEKLTKSLVIEDVKVVETIKFIDVPKIRWVEEEQIKYTTKEVEQVKLVDKVKEQIVYETVDRETVKYIPKVEETVKYIPVETKVEHPIYHDVEYERPKIVEKEYNITSVKDMDMVKELQGLVEGLVKVVKDLNVEVVKVKVNLGVLKDYKLVEEIIRVPKIEYIPTAVERVVWKDIERERPR